MKTSTYIIGGGIAAAVGAAFLGLRKAGQMQQGVLAATGGDADKAKAAASKAKGAKTQADVKAAAAQAEEAAAALPPTSGDVKDQVAAAKKAADEASTPAEIAAAGAQVAAAAEQMAGNTNITAHLTTYWPFTASSGEQKMEGGVHDRRGNALHTIEDFFAGKSDHVSLSGDDKAFPYGQKVLFSMDDGRSVVGRVTDTGGSFRGLGKRYRIMGEEPIDVCVFSKSMKVPSTVTVTIVRGDHLDKEGKDIVASKFKGQSAVTVGECGALHMLGAC